MFKTIVIAEQNKIASVYDKNEVITDLIVERGIYQVGDIYLGVVETILSSINAAFILLDLVERNGFIHVGNLGHLRKNKDNKNIAASLSSQSFVIVQILKEPSPNKGPSVTGVVTLKGRYITIIPFRDKISSTTSIEEDDGIQYTKALIILLKPKKIGIIVDKMARKASFNSIIQDFYTLLYQWDLIGKKTHSNAAPCLISSSKNFISKIMQKVYNHRVNNITVDSYRGAKKIASKINKWSDYNHVVLSIKYYSNHNFLIRNYNLDLVIYKLLQPRINLLKGGYIMIEKTEALTTIDVNSGSFNYLSNPRETILLVNRKAAKQIARQLNLRSISGLIVIDFIDMKYQKDQLELLLYFDSFLRKDSGNPKIIQLSELGLVELTRKRQSQSLSDLFISNSYFSLSPTSNEHKRKIIALDFFLDGLFLQSFSIDSI
jgi:ribonuclease E